MHKINVNDTEHLENTGFFKAYKAYKENKDNNEGKKMSQCVNVCMFTFIKNINLFIYNYYLPFLYR